MGAHGAPVGCRGSDVRATGPARAEGVADARGVAAVTAPGCNDGDGDAAAVTFFTGDGFSVTRVAVGVGGGGVTAGVYRATVLPAAQHPPDAKQVTAFAFTALELIDHATPL